MIEEETASNYVVFDLETTGFSPANDCIIEISALKCENDEIIDRYVTFVNPCIPIPSKITKLTGITDDDVCGAPQIDSVIEKLASFIDGYPLVAHNASFDVGFIEMALIRAGIVVQAKYIDTLGMARDAFPRMENHKLATLIDELELLGHRQTHRAEDDTEATYRLYLVCKEKLTAKRQRARKKQLKEIEKAEGDNKAYLLNLLAIDLEAENDIDGAIENYLKAIDAGFNGMYPYQRIAIIYRKQKRYEDEVAICDRALAELSRDDELAEIAHRKEYAMKKLCPI